MAQPDYSLLNVGRAQGFNTPFENLSQVMQVRNQQLAAQSLAEQRDAVADQRRQQTEKIAQENKRIAGASKALQAGGGVRAAVLQSALQNDPESVPGLTEFFDKTDASAAAAKKLRQEAKDHEAEFLADVAGEIKRRGATPEVVKLGTTYAVEQFPDYEEGVKRLEANLQGAAPEQVNAFLDHVMSLAPSRRQKPQQAPMTVSKGTGVLNPATGKYEVPVPDNPTGGSFEDYLARYVKERNIPPDAVTTGVIEGAKKRYDALNDQPRDPVVAALAQMKLDEAKSGAAGKAAMPAEFQSVIGRILVNAPATRRKSIEQDFARVAASGNYDELKDQIRNAAIQTENVDTKNQVLGRMATMASLNDAASILKEMKAKGVPTGFFTGTVEDLVRKVGKTTNPEYVSLANRLAGTLINYRRAATGVAFGERESSQYEKMFPNYRNELPVNEALIKGLQREMQTYDDVYWESKLGKDGKALVFGKSGAAKDPMGIR